MFKKCLSIAAVSLLFSSPVVSSAQECGQEQFCEAELYRGTLDASGRSRIVYQLPAGQPIWLDLFPSSGNEQLNPVLTVLDSEGRVLASDDNSGFGLNSRVLIFSEVESALTIVAAGASGPIAAGQSFELLVRPSEVRPTKPRDLAGDSEEGGTIRSGDPQLFYLAGLVGQQWEITLEATGPQSSLDPYLEVFEGKIVEGEPAVSDDDGAGGLNSKLLFRVPRDATYTIRASSVGSSGGDYRLLINRIENAEIEGPRQVLELGRGATPGDFRARDTVVSQPELSAFVEYQLSSGLIESMVGDGMASRSLVIDLKRVEMNGTADPLLVLGYHTPFGFATIRRDDDSGGGYDARLTIRIESLVGVDDLSNLRVRAVNLRPTPSPFTISATLDPPPESP